MKKGPVFLTQSVKMTIKVHRVQKKGTDSNFDKFRQSVRLKYRINTCTIPVLRNNDIILTSLKNAVFARRETPEFILLLL